MKTGERLIRWAKRQRYVTLEMIMKEFGLDDIEEACDYFYHLRVNDVVSPKGTVKFSIWK